MSKKKTRKLTLTLEVPGHLDPTEIARIMAGDFFDMNRETDELGPYIDDISLTWEAWVAIELDSVR